MSHPVFTLRTIENVGHIVELLKLVSYNGFPVVDPPLADDVSRPSRIPAVNGAFIPFFYKHKDKGTRSFEFVTIIVLLLGIRLLS